MAYCKQSGRVCPVPMQWKELWDKLLNRRRTGGSWTPPPPLILAAWWETSDAEKSDRFEDHLLWARDHGALDEIAAFVRSLDESKWHHIGD